MEVIRDNYCNERYISCLAPPLSLKKFLTVATCFRRIQKETDVSGLSSYMWDLSCTNILFHDSFTALFVPLKVSLSIFCQQICRTLPILLCKWHFKRLCKEKWTNRFLSSVFLASFLYHMVNLHLFQWHPEEPVAFWYAMSPLPR